MYDNEIYEIYKDPPYKNDNNISKTEMAETRDTHEWFRKIQKVLLGNLGGQRE